MQLRSREYCVLFRTPPTRRRSTRDLPSTCLPPPPSPNSLKMLPIKQATWLAHLTWHGATPLTWWGNWLFFIVTSVSTRHAVLFFHTELHNSFITEITMEWVQYECTHLVLSRNLVCESGRCQSFFLTEPELILLLTQARAQVLWLELSHWVGQWINPCFYCSLLLTPLQLAQRNKTTHRQSLSYIVCFICWPPATQYQHALQDEFNGNLSSLVSWYTFILSPVVWGNIWDALIFIPTTMFVALYMPKQEKDTLLGFVVFRQVLFGEQVDILVGLQLTIISISEYDIEY